MKNQWRVITGFVMVFIIVIFSVINTKEIEVSFGFATYQWPLIFIILGSAFFGALIVLFTFYSSLWQKKKEIKSLRQQTTSFEKELDQKVEAAVELRENEFHSELAEKEQEIIALRQQIVQPSIYTDVDNE